MMTHSEGIRRLKTISGDAVRLLHRLEKQPCTSAQKTELRQLATALKKSLQEEYDRIAPERTQKTRLSLNSLSIHPRSKKCGKRQASAA
jgi:hypothetical protein